MTHDETVDRHAKVIELALSNAFGELGEIIERLEKKNNEARKILSWYANQFCEFGQLHEGCGKFTDENCSGCRARAFFVDGDGNE